MVDTTTDPTPLIELLQPLQLVEESTTPIADVLEGSPRIAFTSSRALMPQLPTAQMAQIQSLDVDCSKDAMVVRMRFDRVFTGLIYSKVQPPPPSPPPRTPPPIIGLTIETRNLGEAQ